MSHLAALRKTHYAHVGNKSKTDVIANLTKMGKSRRPRGRKPPVGSNPLGGQRELAQRVKEEEENEDPVEFGELVGAGDRQELAERIKNQLTQGDYRSNFSHVVGPQPHCGFLGKSVEKETH